MVGLVFLVDLVEVDIQVKKNTLKFKKIINSPENFLANSGWNWTNQDTLPYLSDELIIVSENEAESYYNAANQLYEMFCEAAEYVVINKKYDLLGIPKSLIPLIEYSWENDNHWHLYGRFDFSGGLDDLPIKLIEFNADTATCVPETSIIQWANLMANNLNENKQFNNLFEQLTSTFLHLKSQNRDLEPSLLLSYISSSAEDLTNVEILAEAAQKAGFLVEIKPINEVEFSKEEGVFTSNISKNEYNQFNFWFKLVPWEFIAWDEPDLVPILTDLVLQKKLIILNPAYTLLFQSKGLLKILWDLFPNHPLLLETAKVPIYGQRSVKKVLFGREGANISIVSSLGIPEKTEAVEYTLQDAVYQAYTPFLQDKMGAYYQAGVFFSTEPCGLGFRKGGEIINNTAQFCGHIVE